MRNSGVLCKTLACNTSGSLWIPHSRSGWIRPRDQNLDSEQPIPRCAWHKRLRRPECFRTVCCSRPRSLKTANTTLCCARPVVLPPLTRAPPLARDVILIAHSRRSRFLPLGFGGGGQVLHYVLHTPLYRGVRVQSSQLRRETCSSDNKLPRAPESDVISCPIKKQTCNSHFSWVNSNYLRAAPACHPEQSGGRLALDTRPFDRTCSRARSTPQAKR